MQLESLQAEMKDIQKENKMVKSQLDDKILNKCYMCCETSENKSDWKEIPEPYQGK